jgi:hypothetical protein
MTLAQCHALLIGQNGTEKRSIVALQGREEITRSDQPKANSAAQKRESPVTADGRDRQKVDVWQEKGPLDPQN